MRVDIFLSSILFTCTFLPNATYTINKAWKSKFGRGLEVEVCPFNLAKYVNINLMHSTGESPYRKFENICGNEAYLEY